MPCVTGTIPDFVTSPNLHWKHNLDLLWVLLILPFTLLAVPLLCCWIKLVSPGPCFFRQTRIGRGGEPFTMYKFRTMTHGAETAIHEAHVTRLIEANQPLIKLDGEDGRLIKGGRLIRILGLDELPQLLNILRGEMSVVGPRPCLPGEFQLYDLDHYRRFAVQPGLTGLWQVERTQATTFYDMEEMDIGYVDHLTPWADIKIVAKTPVSLIVQGTGRAVSKFCKSKVWLSGRTPPSHPADAFQPGPRPSNYPDLRA